MSGDGGGDDGRVASWSSLLASSSQRESATDLAGRLLRAREKYRFERARANACNDELCSLRAQLAAATTKQQKSATGETRDTEVQTESDPLQAVRQSVLSTRAAQARIDRILEVQAAVTRKWERESTRADRLEKQQRAMSVKLARTEEALKAASSRLELSRRELQQQRAAAERRELQYEVDSGKARLRQEAAALRKDNLRLSSTVSRLRAECENMRAEMAWLDPSFFDELEDMKFALQQATAMNAAYEETLKKLSASLGVTYDSVISELNMYH